jgi:hypothetical protein
MLKSFFVHFVARELYGEIFINKYSIFNIQSSILRLRRTGVKLAGVLFYGFWLSSASFFSSGSMG